MKANEQNVETLLSYCDTYSLAQELRNNSKINFFINTHGVQEATPDNNPF